MILFILIGRFQGYTQNEASKWCFGIQAGLDFMTTPPTTFSTGMSTQEGCSSISDGAGNLLFYTNGVTVWNQLHQVMTNGTSIGGNQWMGQNCIIVKQPGNANIYYIFTQDWSVGFSYTTVDMSLSTGLGSVTSSNVQLLQGNGVYTYIDKLSATRHCNGTDIWVVTKENNWTWQNNSQQSYFYSFLVTASGLSLTPVISPANTWTNSNSIYTDGSMKISPNGTKIGLTANYNWNINNQGNNEAFELWDFNPGTGAVTNSLALTMGQLNVNGWNSTYGCEFSPDGTKFYGTRPISNNLSNINQAALTQWDLCAGSPTAIVASEYTVAIHDLGSTWVGGYFSMQLAPNGKIYIAMAYSYNQMSTALDLINNPDLSGAACGYAAFAQSTNPGLCYYGLPNFMTSYLSGYQILPFTYTTIANNPNACFTTSYTAPNTPTFACAASGYSVNGILWNFGDPASGAPNTSTLSNPVHAYPAPGIYTTTLTFFNACGSQSVALPITINGASITINSSSITCATLGSATVSASNGIGPFSYTWMPTSQTNSAAVNLQPGNYSITVLDIGDNCAYNSTVNLVPLVPLAGLLDNSSGIPCNGVGTGTASIITANGSGNNNYFWMNGVSTQSTATVNNLSGGIHTITVIDALTSCSVTQNFTITQPPAMALNVIVSSPTACAGTGISFTATNSGGTPGALTPYAYSWTNGPSVNTHTVIEPVAGTYSYYVSSQDNNNCTITNTVSVDFIPNPTVTVANVSICPLQTATLVATGATDYTFFPSGFSAANTFTDNPLVNTGYSIIGSALGCTSSAVSASIILKPVPIPTLTSNGPICAANTLSFNASGGLSYIWNGPAGFNSVLQNPVINTATLNNMGIYLVTVTAANACTATASTSVVIYALPTLSALGSTVCTGQTINLTSISSATNFLWSGPSGFSSAFQNPLISNAALSANGTYSVLATSADNCTTLATVLVNVVPPPSLTVSLSSNTLCTQAFNGSPNTVTLSSQGANTYTLSTPNHIYNPNPAGPNSPLMSLPPFQNTVTVSTATLSGSNGVCTVSTSVSFSILPNPTLSIANPTPVICAGQSYTYTSQGADSYTWGAGSPGLTTYTSAVTVANPSLNSVYAVIGGSMGCNSATETSTLTVNPLPAFNITGNTNICPESSAILTAQGSASSYSWSPSIGLSSSTGFSVSASPMNNQNYMVVGSLNNCTLAAMISVSVLPLPLPQATVSKPEICLYDNVVLNGSGGNLYQWNVPGNTQLFGQQVSFTAQNLNQSGNFTLTVTDGNGCKNSKQVSVLIKKLPHGTIAGNKEGCVPFCTTLNFSSNASTSVNWIFGQQSSSGDNFSYCFDRPGNFTVSTHLYDAVSTCSNVLSYYVNVFAKPSADFSFYPEKPLESFDEVQFTNTSQGAQINQWNWFFINNSGYKTNTENANYLFDDAGVYPVALVIKDVRGCADSIVKAITVEPDFNIYVPTAFTPNDDGRNDIFYPVGRGITEYQLIIFDRWGEKVYSSNDMGKGWDGTFKGEAAKQDVYVWKIDAKNKKGERKNLSGHVTLYR